ncbi:MAG: hypothetical protein R3F56_10805 [Planctomycetota bacterium]
MRPLVLLALLASCRGEPPVAELQPASPAATRATSDPGLGQTRGRQDPVAEQGDDTGRDAEDIEPPLHHADDVTVMARGFYGVPILRRSLFWDGDGEVDAYGGGAFLHWFLHDRFALGLGLEGDVFKAPGHDAYGIEGQLAARVYPYSTPDLGIFVDGTAGYLQTTEQVPPGGTEWNFTFSFGPGVEVPLYDASHLLIGGTYHHISNALGRQNQRNPSQNEFRFWVGLQWAW